MPDVGGPEEFRSVSPEIDPRPSTPPSFLGPTVSDTGPTLDSLRDRTGLPGLIAWGCQVTYSTDQGLAWSPVAGGPGQRQVAIWRTHTGFTVKTVDYAAQAVGGKPEIPSPDTGSGNEVLVHHVESAGFPAVIPESGKQVWAVTGKYIYILQQKPDPTDTLGIGSTPLSTLSPALNTLVYADFIKCLAPAQVAKYNGDTISF